MQLNWWWPFWFVPFDYCVIGTPLFSFSSCSCQSCWNRCQYNFFFFCVCAYFGRPNKTGRRWHKKMRTNFPFRSFCSAWQTHIDGMKSVCFKFIGHLSIFFFLFLCTQHSTLCTLHDSIRCSLFRWHFIYYL